MGFFLLVNVMILQLHLEILRLMRFVSHQQCSCVNISCSRRQSASPLTLIANLKSSANNHPEISDGSISTISLMKARNSMPDMWPPCIHPEVTSIASDLTLMIWMFWLDSLHEDDNVAEVFIFTICFRLRWKLSNQFRSFPSTPNPLSFENSV